MKLIQTLDGSHTIYLSELDESYHSINGAVTESRHVFIDAGFNFIDKENVTLFEVGFGTGLNAILTLLECLRSGRTVRYYSVEPYPLDATIIQTLNYKDYLLSGNNNVYLFDLLHDCEWNQDIGITKTFMLHKIRGSITQIEPPNGINLVYFDAFSPQKQPELWNIKVFEKLFKKMMSGSALTTFCAKGDVRRTLKLAGFDIERLPGPPGKREMMRAIKNH